MRKLFVASPGSMVKSSSGEVFRVGTICPDYRKGRCVFLDENDRCKIHAVAPFGCAYFDTHMSAGTGQVRSSWLAMAQHRSEAYKALRNTLPYARHHKPNRYAL
jgi:Fe-S-cluster containining protein